MGLDEARKQEARSQWIQGDRARYATITDSV